MSGARHNTDEQQGESDVPNSYGPSASTLINRERASFVTKQDDWKKSINREPKPGQELDFN